MKTKIKHHNQTLAGVFLRLSGEMGDMAEYAENNKGKAANPGPVIYTGSFKIIDLEHSDVEAGELKVRITKAEIRKARRYQTRY